jgi:hypothetical protein
MPRCGPASPAAGEATRQAFMTGLHAGSLVAAAATAVAALLALAFLPSRPGASQEATDLPDLASVTEPADTLPFAQNLR